MRKRRQSTKIHENDPLRAGRDASWWSFASRRYAAFALVLIPSILYLGLALDRLWVTEDAFITFRSVETFWRGGGPNFNPGIRVESFSHPLWFFILLVLRIGGSEMVAPLSAFLGVSLSVGGLACALIAGQMRLRGLPRLFPLGGLIVFSLPPFWDFASSGLETGLTFGWIGCVTLLVTSLLIGSKRPSIEGLVLIGLGPLIRIDLVVVAAPLLFVALGGGRGITWRDRSLVGAIAISALPSVAWQVFRMGYYGLVVPTTYLAKEGFESRWDQGFLYFSDTYSLYLLLPVLLLGLFLTSFSLLQTASREDGVRDSWLVPGALMLGGILHTMFVCKAGGDFMHGRLLLPGLFSFASAFAVVSLPARRVLSYGCGAAVILWSSWAILVARPPHGANISSAGIADERQWYVARGRIARPVMLDDYSFHSFHRMGVAIDQLARQKKLSAFYWAHIGIAVAALSSDVIVIDPLTLNDAIGSHVALQSRGRPGHEKIARAAWFTARYPPGVGVVIRNQLGGEFQQRETEEAVQAARTVLQSIVVSEIIDATTSPMSATLFIKNITRAWRLTHLRFPNDPIEALRTLPQRN